MSDAVHHDRRTGDFDDGIRTQQLRYLVESNKQLLADVAEIKHTLAVREGERQGIKFLAAGVSALMGVVVSVLSFIFTHQVAGPGK